MAKIDITADRVRELLDYDPETGVFTRKRKITNSKPIVGGIDSTTGYLRAWLDNKQYSMHRIAWLYVYGVFPSGVIDHIDGDRLNNRINNLRDTTRQTNLQNIRKCYKRNSSGFLGVSEVKDSVIHKWVAHIRHNGVLTHLGTFDSPEIAHEAYLSEKRRLHIGCTI